MSIRSLFDLSGKRALITGGSRGLGLAMAEALGEMGASLVLTARKESELDEARAHLARSGIPCRAIRNDLSAFETIPGLVDALLAEGAGLDILVNNAGCSWGGPAESLPDEAWRKVVDLDLSAQFFLTREIARRTMIPRKAGKIVNIASIAGLAGNPPQWDLNTIAYNSAKGGLIAMTRALAAEWGRHNIQVNAVCPGFFRTKMSAGALDRIEDSYVAMTPAGRLGLESDLKGIVLLLASAASDYITGQAIAVDGGFSAV